MSASLFRLLCTRLPAGPQHLGRRTMSRVVPHGEWVGHHSRVSRGRTAGDGDARMVGLRARARGWQAPQEGHLR